MLLILSAKHVHITGDNATRYCELRVPVHTCYFLMPPGVVHVKCGETGINLGRG